MRLPTLGFGVTLLIGCLPDNPVVDGESDTAGDTDTGGETVDAGLLGCPSGESCTVVVVSQTIDDRLELFTAEGPTPSYRGAIDLDLKPNPSGDISGSNLDEPYGLAWDGAALHVLIGHFPTEEIGSLVSLPATGLANYDAGAWLSHDDWFLDGQVIGLGASLRGLDRTEPLAMLVHEPSGELLISTFANDLKLPEPMWTVPSELLLLDPANAAEPRVVDLGCAGAWSIVALDDVGVSFGLACDGDERVVIVQIAAGGDGESVACDAEIPFDDKRVRYLARDGLGGLLVAEQPQIISATEDARLWWYDGDCQMRGFTALDGPLSWNLRQLALLDGAAPRWLLARADGDERGVLIVAGDVAGGSLSMCGRLDALDDANAWTAAGGSAPLEPHALALTQDRRGLAVTTAPQSYDSAGPGYGSLWWTTLDYADEPCDAVALDPIELGASAPAVDPLLPQTWRRAPDVVEIIELGGTP
jgi:hypothetical protein